MSAGRRQRFVNSVYSVRSFIYPAFTVFRSVIPFSHKYLTRRDSPGDSSWFQVENQRLHKRQMCKVKVGAIPQDFVPILDRLECGAETWRDFVKNFRKRFRNEAGLPMARRAFPVVAEATQFHPLHGFRF